MAYDGDISMPEPPGPDPQRFLDLASRLHDQAQANYRIAQANLRNARNLFALATVVAVTGAALACLALLHFYGIYWSACE